MDDGNGTIQQGWKDLIEAYPDRVIFGSDVGPPGRLEIYAEILAYYRQLFSQLSPEHAAKVGHENAMRIYGMD
jgi:predicted TIM-barrel fold metal-dependent hydrolase